MRVALEKVAGQWQGAVFPFRAGFQSGNNRLAFAPDGSLWVGQTDRGWGATGGKEFGLQRLVCSDGRCTNDGACSSGLCCPGEVEEGAAFGRWVVEQLACRTVCSWGEFACTG